MQDEKHKNNMPLFRRLLFGGFALIVAAAIWLPLVHFLFKDNLSQFHGRSGIPPKALALAKHQMNIWTDDSLRKSEIEKMRNSNAEWDFMARTFFVLSLANMALREPARKTECLEIIDRIIEETCRLEREKGQYHFLMNYAQASSFVVKPGRSLFIDGEIALMIGARRIVEEKPDYKPMLAERVKFMIEQMSQSPVLTGESYPDECWMFCNSAALASIRIADVLDGTDHSEFLQRWIAKADEKLIHKNSGLIVSTCTVEGEPMEGPEGSTLWMVAHFLYIVDEDFARRQYKLARAELGWTALGFGWAREWPRSWVGKMDIDSGPIVPIMKASAGSSGQAFVAAATFEDVQFLSALNTSLNFAAFPAYHNGSLQYSASNQVGDAVLLYSMTLGPLWAEVKKRGR